MNIHENRFLVPKITFSKTAFLKLCKCKQWLRKDGRKDWDFFDKKELLTALEHFTQKDFALVIAKKKKRNLRIKTTDKLKKVTEKEFFLKETPLFIRVKETKIEGDQNFHVENDDTTVITIMPNILWLTGGYATRPYKYHELLEQHKGIGAKRKQRMKMFMNYVTHRANADLKAQGYFLIERTKLAYKIGLNRHIEKREQKSIDAKIQQVLEDAKGLISAFSQHENSKNEIIYKVFYSVADFKKIQQKNKTTTNKA